MVVDSGMCGQKNDVPLATLEQWMAVRCHPNRSMAWSWVIPCPLYTAAVYRI